VIIRTRLTGLVSAESARAWQRQLQAQLRALPDRTQFALLLDIRGYEPADLDAHKVMRAVVPEILIRHGMRPAFLDLFPGTPEPVLETERGIRVIAFANVHHDATKMSDYERRIGRDDQRFFTDINAAEEWLESVLSARLRVPPSSD
jgi:hypothetical protein